MGKQNDVGLVLALLAFGVPVAACGESEAEVEEPAAPEAPYSPPRAHAPAGPPPIARVAQGPQRGQALTEGTEIRATGSTLTLDLRDGARVEMLEGSQARLTGEAPAQLILSLGTVHAILPPMGSSPRPPLRVGTPAGTLHLGGSGDAWVVVFPDGRAWFSVTGGRAEALLPSGERVALIAGQALAAGATEPTRGPEDESTARALIAQLTAQSGDGALDAGLLQPALAALDESVSAAEASWQRGAALQAAHREASKAGSGRETLLALAQFGQETERVRQAVLLHYERARAISHRLGVSPDPVAQRRVRVRSALRLGEEEAQ